MSPVSRRDFIKTLGAGMVALGLPPALVRATASAAESAIPLEAFVTLKSTVPTAYPLNRRLFGQFCEHLGKNVYGGAWAQILPNPDFVPLSTWPDKNALVSQLTTYSRSHSLPLLDVGAARGVLPPWWDKRTGINGNTVKAGVGAYAGRPTLLLSEAQTAAGPATDNPALVNRATVGSTIVNSVAADSSTSDPIIGGCVVTPVYLPTHRVRRYIVRIRAQGPGLLQISLRQSSLLSELASQIVQLGSWSTHEVSLELYTSIPSGTPCELALSPVAGTVEVQQCLLFPADQLDGWDPDVVRLMCEAQVPLLRFPGGNFVSGYRWEDGVGPLESRPVKPNTAWPIVEWNHVGTDEWLHLCELVGCEPLICVNAGDGTPEEAARLVEYCNGPITSPMGARRAKNGHPTPYRVHLWEVGNELYGNWQTGHTDSFGYGLRYKKFAAQMLAVDPSIELIANGNTADWNQVVVYLNEGNVRSFSHHALTGNWPTNSNPDNVYLEHMANSGAYAKQWEELTLPQKKRGATPHLAITEMQVFTQVGRLPNNATFTEALWVASILNEAIRSDGLVELITHSALVNHGGGLRKDQELVWAQPIWWLLQLYSTLPVGLYRLDTAVESPTFTVQQPLRMRTLPNAAYLDAVGFSNKTGSVLAYMLVNRHPKQAVNLQLGIPTGQFHQIDKATLAAPSYMTTNTRNSPDAVRPVYVTSNWTDTDNAVKLTLAPLSITRLIIS